MINLVVQMLFARDKSINRLAIVAMEPVEILMLSVWLRSQRLNPNVHSMLNVHRNLLVLTNTVRILA